jgi:hypothetical protein
MLKLARVKVYCVLEYIISMILLPQKLINNIFQGSLHKDSNFDIVDLLWQKAWQGDRSGRHASPLTPGPPKRPR